MNHKKRTKLGIFVLITIVLFAAGSLWVVHRVAAWAWDLPNRISGDIQIDSEAIAEFWCESVLAGLQSDKKEKQLETIQFLCDQVAETPELVPLMRKEFVPQLKELCADSDAEVRDAACHAVEIIEAAPDPQVKTRSGKSELELTVPK